MYFYLFSKPYLNPKIGVWKWERESTWHIQALKKPTFFIFFGLDLVRLFIPWCFSDQKIEKSIQFNVNCLIGIFFYKTKVKIYVIDILKVPVYAPVCGQLSVQEVNIDP